MNNGPKRHRVNAMRGKKTKASWSRFSIDSLINSLPGSFIALVPIYDCS